MKHPRLVAAVLACSLLSGAPFVHGESGRIDFSGSIVAPGCSLRDGTFDCPPGTQVNAVVRPLELAYAQDQIHATLFAYALQRDRTVRWQVVDISYR